MYKRSIEEFIPLKPHIDMVRHNNIVWEFFIEADRNLWVSFPHTAAHMPVSVAPHYQTEIAHMVDSVRNMG